MLASSGASAAPVAWSASLAFFGSLVAEYGREFVAVGVRLLADVADVRYGVLVEEGLLRRRVPRWWPPERWPASVPVRRTYSAFPVRRTTPAYKPAVPRRAVLERRAACLCGNTACGLADVYLPSTLWTRWPLGRIRTIAIFGIAQFRKTLRAFRPSQPLRGRSVPMNSRCSSIIDPREVCDFAQFRFRTYTAASPPTRMANR